MRSSRHPHRPRKVRLLRLLPDAWVRTSGPCGDRVLYLSFDDGPNAVHTPALLELLAEHDARATFFLIGKHIDKHPALARRIVDAGHAIGNHSYSHPHFEQLSLAAQIDEVNRTEQLLSDIDRRQGHAFRPPRGVLTVPMLWHFIRANRHITYWSWNSMDYSQRQTGELLQMARANPPRTGDIILMHDDSDVALLMLGTLLPEWKAKGFRFDALPVEAG